MALSGNAPSQERWTSADAVYHELHEQISTLALMPGDKISEAEIAAKFGISRQPVRDAFSRLGNMGLVQIRPQKATQVKKFSLADIRKARFVRLSVELEVLNRAAKNWDNSLLEVVNANLARQRSASDAGDASKFHSLDYDFHQIFCEAAGASFAMDIIAQNKAIVDRLCVLSLNEQEQRIGDLIEDHETIYSAVRSKDYSTLQSATRAHLSRLDNVIDAIYEKHAKYFED